VARKYNSDLQAALLLNIGYRFGMGLGFFFSKSNLIPNYARIKIPNISPAFKFTQQKAVSVTIKDEIKYLYTKKQLNQQLLQVR